MSTTDAEDLTVARLESCDGRRECSCAQDGGVPRSVQIIRAINAVSGNRKYLDYEAFGDEAVPAAERELNIASHSEPQAVPAPGTARDALAEGAGRPGDE